MPTYIALLRGINVGGHNRVPMKELAALFATLGFQNVCTHIQSGNVVFSGGKASPAALSKKIEDKILAKFGFPVSVVTRTPEELARIIAGNPFTKECKAEPGRVHVAFLSEAAKDEAIKKLQAFATPTEQLHCCDREVYLYYRDGMGRAKLTAAVVERVLALRATARNWNTITKLYEMAKSQP